MFLNKKYFSKNISNIFIRDYKYPQFNRQNSGLLIRVYGFNSRRVGKKLVSFKGKMPTCRVVRYEFESHTGEKSTRAVVLIGKMLVLHTSVIGSNPICSK